MTTIDNIMALALNYRLAGSASRDEHEEALRTALTEALAPTASPVIGCVQHDCAECRAKKNAESLLQDVAAHIGVGGYNGATPKQLAERICAEFERLDGKARAAQLLIPPDSRELEQAAQPARVPVAITRDDTEHGVYYYRASEVDALMAARPIREPMKPLRTEFRAWEKAVLGKPNPADFGIPKEHCEAAKHYAEFFHLNKLDAVRGPSCETCKHCTVASQDSFEETCFVCSQYYNNKYEAKK